MDVHISPWRLSLVRDRKRLWEDGKDLWEAVLLELIKQESKRVNRLQGKGSHKESNIKSNGPLTMICNDHDEGTSKKWAHREDNQLTVISTETRTKYHGFKKTVRRSKKLHYDSEAITPTHYTTTSRCTQRQPQCSYRHSRSDEREYVKDTQKWWH